MKISLYLNIKNFVLFITFYSSKMYMSRLKMIENALYNIYYIYILVKSKYHITCNILFPIYKYKIKNIILCFIYTLIYYVGKFRNILSYIMHFQ